MQKVLFYSSVRDKNLFNTQSFYSTDIQILNEIGYQVRVTNRISDFFFPSKYDLAFIYFYRYGLIPAIISQIYRKPVVFTGGIDALDKVYMKGNRVGYIVQCILFKLCYWFSDRCIVVSTSDKKNILRLVKPNDSKLFYIPHVINVKGLSVNLQKKQLITTIAWMHTVANIKRKGVDKLLFVLSEFKKIRNDFKLIIIGTLGEGYEHIQSIVNDLNLNNDVVFTGNISEQEKNSYLDKSKYYFQLSEYEGFGIAAIEGLFHGNIVFHTNKGGLKDSIGEYGIICDDPVNYSSIALLLSEIDNNYDKYSSYINEGINHINTNFSYKIRFEGIKNMLINIKKG